MFIHFFPTYYRELSIHPVLQISTFLTWVPSCRNFHTIFLNFYKVFMSQFLISITVMRKLWQKFEILQSFGKNSVTSLVFTMFFRHAYLFHADLGLPLLLLSIIISHNVVFQRIWNLPNTPFSYLKILFITKTRSR